MLLFIFLFCLVGGSFAQTLGFGPCPNVTTIASFNPTKYHGLWYENRRSVPNLFEFAGKCVTANYTANADKSIKVVNEQLSWITGKNSKIVGTATQDTSKCGKSTSCGKLIVQFPISMLGKFQGSYWILDTDYKSYSVVWSCTNIIFNHAKFLWVLTRQQNPTQAVLDKAQNVLKVNGLVDVLTAVTDQTNCP